MSSLLPTCAASVRLKVRRSGRLPKPLERPPHALLRAGAIKASPVLLCLPPVVDDPRNSRRASERSSGAFQLRASSAPPSPLPFSLSARPPLCHNRFHALIFALSRLLGQALGQFKSANGVVRCVSLDGHWAVRHAYHWPLLSCLAAPPLPSSPFVFFSQIREK